MVHILKPLLYKAFGFDLTSHISFPELQELEYEQDSYDISIKLENGYKYINELSLMEKKVLVKRNLVVFEVTDIAVFSIEDGRKITITPLNGYEEDIVRLYILGTCFGALLFQRRILPLHGSVVSIKGKAYAFIGDSGAGKSTLASAFIDRGYHILSDDIIPVTISEDTKPIVTPTYPQQKLWQNSLQMFGFQPEEYKSIYGRETKYCVPINKRYSTEKLQLGAIFELTKSSDANLSIEQIKGISRLKKLYHHTYRNFLIQGMELNEWHFNYITNIANKVSTFQIRRPINENSVEQLVSSILNIAEEK